MSLFSLFLVVLLMVVTLVHHFKLRPDLGNRFNILNSYSKQIIHLKRTQPADKMYLNFNMLKACIPEKACMWDLITRLVVSSQRGRMVA